MAIKSDTYSAASNSGDTRSLLSGDGNAPVQQPPPYITPGPQVASTPASLHHGVPMGPSPFHSLPTPVTFGQEGALAIADMRARRRAFAALLWGWGIWIFVGLLTSNIVANESIFKHRHDGSRNHDQGNRLPLPPHAVFCNGLDGTGNHTGLQMDRAVLEPPSFIARIFPFLSTPLSRASRDQSWVLKTSFAYTFPLESRDTLTFDSSGGYSSGSIKMSVNYSDDETKEGEHTGLVEVQAEFNDASLFEQSQVCLMRKETSTGVFSTGILLKTPHRDDDDIHPERWLTWKFTIQVPKGLKSLAGLEVSTLETSFDSVLPGGVPSISNVQIKTANSPIYITGLNSTNIELKTSNARIQVLEAYGSQSILARTANSLIDGEFDGPNTTLSTTNAKISGLFKNQGVLDLSTSNGGIDAKILLVAPASPSTSHEARFVVHARSKNGQVNVEYLEQPRDSHLTSRVATSNARASVRLHPEYQGAFEIRTNLVLAKLDGPFTTIDPSHAGRSRVMTSTKANHGSIVEGTVWWEYNSGTNKPELRGFSDISSGLGMAETVLL